MFIIITGNPVDGFEYLGPFGTSVLAAEHATKTDVDESDWWTASLSDDNGTIKPIEAVPQPKIEGTTFVVTEVNVARGPFWTVRKLMKEFSFGGDHHWLGKEIAESAKRLYEANPEMWGRSSTDVLAAYTTRFGEPPTGLIEG